MMRCLTSRGLPGRLVLLLVGLATVFIACAPEESPLKQDNERLRKQVTKQDSMIVSLQEGHKVMQQQIDLLNQELRSARQETDREKMARQAASAQAETMTAENRKLSADAGRLAAKKALVMQSLKIADSGGQSEELAHPLTVVYKAANDALAQHGYTVRLTVQTDQRAVYVTERKISPAASLEVPGFRNQYLVVMQGLTPKATRLSVKADFEKMTQGNKVLSAGAEEVAEIERRLIAEIQKALGEAGKI